MSRSILYAGLVLFGFGVAVLGNPHAQAILPSALSSDAWVRGAGTFCLLMGAAMISRVLVLKEDGPKADPPKPGPRTKLDDPLA